MSEAPRPTSQDSQTDPTNSGDISGMGDYSDEEKAALLELRAQRAQMEAQEALMLARIHAVRAAGGVAVGSEAEARPSPHEIQQAREEWQNKEYEKIRAGWEKHGITPPSQEELHYKLSAAYEVKGALESADYRFKDRLGVVLVPPTDVVGWPVPEGLRETSAGFAGQRHARNTIPTTGLNPAKRKINRLIPGKSVDTSIKDHVDKGIPAPAPSNEWRVIIADTSESGLYMGSPKQNLEDGLYNIGGYDTRGMGTGEYAALTLQTDRALDYPTTTWLLKDGVDPQKGAVQARYSGDYDHNYIAKPHHGQHISFEFRNPEAKHGTARFRAAVEITHDMAMSEYHAAVNAHTLSTVRSLPQLNQHAAPTPAASPEPAHLNPNATQF